MWKRPWFPLINHSLNHGLSNWCFNLIMFFNQWIESVPPTCDSLSNAGWGIHSSVDFCNFVIHDIVKDTFWKVFSSCSETWVMMVMVLLQTQIWIWHPFEMWTFIEDVDFSLPSSLNLLRASADASEFDEGINRGCLFMLQYPACAMIFQGRFPTSMVHRLAGVCRWCLAKEAGDVCQLQWQTSAMLLIH